MRGLENSQGGSGDDQECERWGGLWRVRQIAWEDLGDSPVRRADECVYTMVARIEALPFRIAAQKVTRSGLEIAHPSRAQRKPLNVFGLIWQLSDHLGQDSGGLMNEFLYGS